MPHVVDALVEEVVPQAVPRVGEQRLNRSAVGGGVQPVHTVDRREVSLQDRDRRTERTEVLRRLVLDAHAGD